MPNHEVHLHNNMNVVEASKMGHMFFGQCHSHILIMLNPPGIKLNYQDPLNAQTSGCHRLSLYMRYKSHPTKWQTQ